MKQLQPLLLATLLATGSAAHAITFEGSLTQGATVVADYASAGLISFDIDFANFAPAVVSYRIDDADVGLAIDFNAILRNFTALGFTGYTIGLSVGSFGELGSVTRQFSGTATVSGNGGFASIAFNTPEFLDVEIGNALGSTPNAADWAIAGLQSGDRINLTVTPVPEPGTYAMLLAGMAALGFMAQRRKR